MKTLTILAFLGVLTAMAVPVWANSVYLLGNGVNSGNIEWNDNENFASVQVFPTSSDKTIVQLKVGSGSAAGDAQVVLYSLDNGYQLPKGGLGLVDTSKMHVLQVVNTTVTAGQTNPVVWMTQTPTTWTTYDISPTTITTNFFAVGTIQHLVNPFTDCTNTMDMTTSVLPLDGSAGYSWFGKTYAGTEHPAVSLSADLHEAGTGWNPGLGWVEEYAWAGYGNNPYNLAAVATTPVPEPITMGTLFLALSGLGAWARRRAKQEA